VAANTNEELGKMQPPMCVT